jgi:hypothetical protein
MGHFLIFSLEIIHYMLCSGQKNTITHFKNQRYIGIFMFLYIFWATSRYFSRGQDIFDPLNVLSAADYPCFFCRLSKNPQTVYENEVVIFVKRPQNLTAHIILIIVG